MKKISITISCILLAATMLAAVNFYSTDFSIKNINEESFLKGYYVDLNEVVFVFVPELYNATVYQTPKENTIFVMSPMSEWETSPLFQLRYDASADYYTFRIKKSLVNVGTPFKYYVNDAWIQPNIKAPNQVNDNFGGTNLSVTDLGTKAGDINGLFYNKKSGEYLFIDRDKNIFALFSGERKKTTLTENDCKKIADTVGIDDNKLHVMFENEPHLYEISGRRIEDKKTGQYYKKRLPFGYTVEFNSEAPVITIK